MYAHNRLLLSLFFFLFPDEGTAVEVDASVFENLNLDEFDDLDVEDD